MKKAPATTGALPPQRISVRFSRSALILHRPAGVVLTGRSAEISFEQALAAISILCRERLELPELIDDDADNEQTVKEVTAVFHRRRHVRSFLFCFCFLFLRLLENVGKRQPRSWKLSGFGHCAE